MITRSKLLLAAGIAGMACLGALAVSFYFTEDKIEAKSALLSDSRSQESSSSSLKNDPADAQSILSASNNPEIEMVKSFGSNAGIQREPADESSSGKANSRKADGLTPESALAEAPEVSSPHMPLVFLDHGGILPETEQVAAAVQNLQQDFVKATGADTITNPADPNFQRAWEWARPTADEQFYAIFGIEAFNALSITEAREDGHF